MENIIKIQNLLKEKDLDAYIITSSDNHFNEYLPDHYKTIEFLTGFTGEGATLIITKNEAALWIDSRFFIQAELEVNDKKIKIMKDGEHNVPSIHEYLESNSIESENIGFDGKLISKKFADTLKSKVPNISLISTDLIDEIWTSRPKPPVSLLYLMDNFFSGESFQSKLEKIRLSLNSAGANSILLSKLEDQAWLYNLRGNDINYTPVFTAFSFITLTEVHLFIDSKKITDEVKKYLNDNDIIIHQYKSFYVYISNLENNVILLDPRYTSYIIYRSLYINNDIINQKNPTEALKSIKNEVEILNTKQAHIKDGVALVKSIYYLYNNINNLTEISFANYLEEKRKNQKGFIELSFPTIAAFKENGAIVHYNATEATNKDLNDSDKTFFLVDSGAHYAEGTTDITRTFALGPVTDEMKKHYTIVLKSAIALANTTFIKGCSGSSLDILARAPMWKNGYNFGHGTGHGVGHVLAVHEGTQSFSYKSSQNITIEPGMITTDEPGLYFKNMYGIRIENELLCVSNTINEYGHFYKFENITLCPIDTKAIDPEMLTFEEKKWLNDYHKMVYTKLNKYLTKAEKEWLLEATKPIE